jgi:hypothetical protein
MVPSGRSCKNSKAAVSFSIKDILINNSKSDARHSKTKSSLLSAANNDLVSLSFVEVEFTNQIVCLAVYGVCEQI